MKKVADRMSEYELENFRSLCYYHEFTNLRFCGNQEKQITVFEELCFFIQYMNYILGTWMKTQWGLPCIAAFFFSFIKTDFPFSTWSFFLPLTVGSWELACFARKYFNSSRVLLCVVCRVHLNPSITIRRQSVTNYFFKLFFKIWPLLIALWVH